MTRGPRTVIHADWSVSAAKRWAASACARRDGRYRVASPVLVTPAEMVSAAREPSTLIGFDFPIGLPAAYARVAGIRSFTKTLSVLGTGVWSSFFEPATSRARISVHRPFYPHAPGGTKREHLVRALGLSTTDDLYRACDTASGRRACPLFWTLGGNQVGKGALAGWKEVLRPARELGGVDLWPFDGSLKDLLARGRAVIVETYPADAYLYVGATLPRMDGRHGKRVRESRAASAPDMLRAADRAGVELAPLLVEEIRDGFGLGTDGEDRFDAVVGLLGMLAVLRGERAPGEQDRPTVRAVEGWILGRAS